jgi:hypothetical protein
MRGRSAWWFSGGVIVLLLVAVLAGAVLLQYSIDNTSAAGTGWKDSSPFDTAHSIMDVLGGLRETIAAYFWSKTDDVFHGYLGADIGKEDALYPYYWMITRLDPHFTMPFYFASWTLARMGKVEEGFNLAMEGLRNNPYSASMQENLAYIYLFFKKDPRKARYHILKAIELTDDKQQKAVYQTILRIVDRIITGKRKLPDLLPFRHTEKINEEVEQQEHEHHHN